MNSFRRRLERIERLRASLRDSLFSDNDLFVAGERWAATGKFTDDVTESARERILLMHGFRVGTAGLVHVAGDESDRRVLVRHPLGDEFYIHERDLVDCLAHGYRQLGPVEPWPEPGLGPVQDVPDPSANLREGS